MIGKEILNYVITGFIGKGGMGSVYAAENKHISQQKVAIKVINADMVNEFTRNKLKEEAERLATLNHPNIVHFLNYHIDEEGNVYLIMEYADGVSLEKYIETISGLIVEDRICPLFEPILDAVGYAHKHNILHRDIKPSNIIITNEGAPKILDFGIAKIIKNDGNEDSDNLIMGTPSYMSPEQVKGEKLDERSDIYSLGVLLHQMLTGNAPYDTTTMTEIDINQKIVEEKLPRMKTYYKYVSDKVQAVVDKATAKRPDDRYRSCEEFKKALHNAIYPPKMPLWLKLSAAAVLLLIVGAGVYWWDYTRTKVFYYKDYVEQWGIPVGIGEISDADRTHVERMYRMEYTRNKLQRLSHVNSFDNIIDDSESERVDRPLDARYFYTAEGKIRSVKVSNRFGKVLYVKEYNDNLQTAIFRYDDVNGTEKTLGSQTVGYVHALDDGDQRRGKISRYLLEYDADGYVKTIRYAGFQNVRVGDDNNIYGISYKHDAKGRVIEVAYLGKDDMPKATRWGMGKKIFYYDDKDNWVRAEYQTPDGAPALDDADGTCIYVLKYDQYGNLTNSYLQDENGKPMYPKKHGFAAVHDLIDDRGLVTQKEILDENGNLMFYREGYAILKLKYDEHGYVNETSVWDVDGNPVLSTDGYHRISSVNDAKGNTLQYWTYGLDGNLVATNSQSAGLVNVFDSVGNLLSQMYYDVNRNPVLQDNGTAGVLLEYDQFSRRVKWTNLGVDSLPCYSTDENVECIAWVYDPSGNCTETSYRDAETNELVENRNGIAVIKYVWDDKGNMLEKSFFDKKGEPRESYGYAVTKYTYDENGYTKTERYYDAKGRLAINASEGNAGADYVHDERGNVLVYYPVGRDEKIMKGKLEVRRKYDSADNEIEWAVYDNGRPAINSLGYHKITRSYNSRNQEIECRYYDEKGNLTKGGNDIYSIVRYEYDARGNVVKVSYFDKNDKPMLCRSGMASVQKEYDAYGHSIRELNYDTEGRLTDPKIMTPEARAEYDRQGNLICSAAYDGKGKRIPFKQNNFSYIRSEFDNRNNKLYDAYFDENEMPVVSKEHGYHKVVYTYDDQTDWLLSEQFFNASGKPMTCNGYHKQAYTYDAQGRKTVEQIFDVNGNPTNGNYGFAKAVYEFRGDSREAHACKVYGANGKLVNSYHKDASGNWALDEATYSSGYAASASSSTDGNQNLNDIVEEINKSLPMTVDNGRGLVMREARQTGRTLEFLLVTPNSKYDTSEEDMQFYTQYVDLFVSEMKKSLNMEVVGILYDSKGRELMRTK